MVQVVTDLEPVAEYGDGEGAGGKLEALSTEFRDGNGDNNGREEGQKRLFQQEEIHVYDKRNEYREAQVGDEEVGGSGLYL